MCRAPGKAALWALLGRPLDTFKSPCVNRWFQESCLLLGLRPPQDEKWVGHSHRSGGATGALSIEASFSLGQFVWSRMSMHLATICPPQPLGVGTSPCLRQSAWSGEGLPSHASGTPSSPSLSAIRTSIGSSTIALTPTGISLPTGSRHAVVHGTCRYLCVCVRAHTCENPHKRHQHGMYGTCVSVQHPGTEDALVSTTSHDPRASSPAPALAHRRRDPLKHVEQCCAGRKTCPFHDGLRQPRRPGRHAGGHSRRGRARRALK